MPINMEMATRNADSIQEHEDLASAALHTHPPMITPHASSSHPTWRPGTNAHHQNDHQNTPPLPQTPPPPHTPPTIIHAHPPAPLPPQTTTPNQHNTRPITSETLS